MILLWKLKILSEMNAFGKCNVVLRPFSFRKNVSEGDSTLLQRARKPVTPLENRVADSGRLSLTPNSEGNRRKMGSPYNTTPVVTTPEQLQQYLVTSGPPSLFGPHIITYQETPSQSSLLGAIQMLKSHGRDERESDCFLCNKSLQEMEYDLAAVRPLPYPSS